jgi:hypothetical protein
MAIGGGKRHSSDCFYNIHSYRDGLFVLLKSAGARTDSAISIGIRMLIF